MRRHALRWILAAAAAAALLTWLWTWLAGRELLRPGSSLGNAEQLTGARAPRRREGRALKLEPCRKVKGRVPEARTGLGLGARLVEGGRPRGPLRPLDLASHLPVPGPRRVAARELAPQAAPPPSRQDAAAERARAAAAAAAGLPTDYAPKRRRIPPRPRPPIDLRRALALPARPPRLGSAGPTALPAAPEGPAPEKPRPVSGPDSRAKLPAPAVPLELENSE